MLNHKPKAVSEFSLVNFHLILDLLLLLSDSSYFCDRCVFLSLADMYKPFCPCVCTLCST